MAGNVGNLLPELLTSQVLTAALAVDAVAPPVGDLRLVSHLRSRRVHRSGNGSRVRRIRPSDRDGSCSRCTRGAAVRCGGRSTAAPGLSPVHRQRRLDGGVHRDDRHRAVGHARLRLRPDRKRGGQHYRPNRQHGLNCAFGIRRRDERSRCLAHNLAVGLFFAASHRGDFLEAIASVRRCAATVFTSIPVAAG